MQRVFFLYGQQEVGKLRAWLSRVPASPPLSAVVSCLPGLDLGELADCARERGMELLTLEECLERFQITQLQISERETQYVLALMSEQVVEPALRQSGFTPSLGLRNAMLNQLALMVHNSVALEMVFAALVSQGLREALSFHPGGGFALIDRLDVAALLRPGLMMGPHLEWLCRGSGVSLQFIGRPLRGLAPLTNTARNLLLRAYKGYALLRRSIAQKRHPDVAAPHGHGVLFALRADTELASARPVVEALTGTDGHDVLLFVDDLLKSPTATRAVSASGLPWMHAHSFTGALEVLATLGRVWLQTCRATRLIRRRHRELDTPLDAFGFLGCDEAVAAILSTAMASVPELVVYGRQFERMLDACAPKVLVSFDTVDRWGAVQAALCRARGIPSLMVQNTALDWIRYPLPVSTDHLIVANLRLRELMIASGAAPDSVHAFGLPQHDRLINAGDERLAKRCQQAEQGGRLRILVATQPFVQAFDYNGQLLDDLVKALNAIGAEADVILKPHPREAQDRYEALVGSWSGQQCQVRLQSGHFDEALDSADVVLSRTSTSLQLSVLGGLPSIAYLRDYPADIVSRLDYLEDPVTDKCFGVEELSRALSVYLRADQRPGALQRFADRRAAYLAAYFPGGGGATRRVLELIQRMASGRTGTA